MSRLTVVVGDVPAPDAAFADACRAALDRALVSGAVVMLIVFEGRGVIDSICVPPSVAVERGLLGMRLEAYEATNGGD